MQAVSSIYKKLLSNPNHKKECKIEIGGYVFGMDSLIDLQTDGGLYRTPTIGNAFSRQIQVSLFPNNSIIPRMAEMKVYIRLTCDNESSEWIPKGVFYIDTRQIEKETGVLTIHGYDSMLKMEQTYISDGEDVTGWPKTMPVVMAEIAEKIDVELDDRNVLQDYLVEAPVGYTMREVSGWIAAAHAGNWTITDAGKLRLVPLYSNILTLGYLVDESRNPITFGGVKILV